MELVCAVCSFRSKTPSQAKTHLKCHGAPTVFCPECDKGFTRPSHLDSHRLIHSDIKPFACTGCDKTFKRKSELSKHAQSHTTRNICPDCFGIYANPASLRVHQVSCKNKGVGTMGCTQCTRVFATKRGLALHIKWVHN